jgi:hypothetical protein
MGTHCRDVCMQSAHLWSCERVVVLGSRPVKGDTVNELIESKFITGRVRLDGQGRLQVLSPGPGGHLWLE